MHDWQDIADFFRIGDNQIPLTPRGHEQAEAAGRKLREIIGDETVMFFVSPFKRSRETFEGIAKAFDASQYSVLLFE